MKTLSIIVVILAAAATARAQTLVVRGDIVHTMAGDPINDGAVICEDGKIAFVGPFADADVPDGAEIRRAAVVTPGLIDARCVIGVSGWLNIPHDQDQLERSEPMQPDLRALDAFNIREPLVEWVRSFGVTAIHTGHAPGELISGQTMVVKTAGNTVDDAVVKPLATVAATLSPQAAKSGGKSPGNRAKMMAMLRTQLLKAQADAAQRADRDVDESGDESDDDDEGPGAVDLRMETLNRVLNGEIPLMITANRAQDIASALRLQREFGFRMILDSAAEAYLLLDEIAAADVPVIVHPPMYRAVRELENLSFETPATLVDAGIPVAMQAGYETYVPKTRVVLLEAAIAAANGLTFEQALRTITIDAARILGVDDRLGSLEVGKDADLALYDGDPFEYMTHCVGVVLDGAVVSDVVR